MLDFIKKSTWSLLSVAVKTVSSILINKVVAIQYGTSGISLFAHFQNLISLVTQIPNDGVNRGIIKFWSGEELNVTEKNKMFFTGLLMNLIILSISIVTLYLFKQYFFRDFNFTIGGLELLILISSISIYIVHLYLLSLILSFQKIKIYSIINGISSIIVVIVIVIVAYGNVLKFVLFGYLIAQSMGIVFTISYCLRKKFLRFSYTKIHKNAFRRLGEFVLMALSVLLFGKLTDFIVRDYAIQSFGLHQTGLWQSIVKISDGYLMLFINTVGIVYYPQVSALILHRNRLKIYLRDVLKIVIIITVLGFSLIYYAREPLVILLYNTEFLPAIDLMPMQLLGDFFCIIAYFLTYIISAQSRTRVFISLQAGSAVLYMLLIYVLSQYSGIYGIPTAHAIRYCILVLILIFLNKRIIF